MARVRRGRRAQQADRREEEEEREEQRKHCCDHTAPVDDTPVGELRGELLATLRNDFVHLSDVHELLYSELPRFSDFGALVLHDVLHLDTVQEVILRHLDDLPEWQRELRNALPDGSHMTEAFRALRASAAGSLPSLPDAVVQHLHSLPAVRDHVSEALSTAGHHLVDSVRDNLHSVHELVDLVGERFDSLPLLRRQIANTYIRAKPELKSIEATPLYRSPNEYILTGYRPELLSYRRCFQSLFYIHNETGNIYTHLLGAIVFVILWVYCEHAMLSDHPIGERLVLSAFFLGALVCLLGSTLFHTCAAHSHHVHVAFNKLDYAGISSLIGGSCLPITYYAHYCHPVWAGFYMALIVLCGVICTMATFSPKLLGGNNGVRVMIFIVFALTGVVPVLHFAYWYDVTHMLRVVDVFWVAVISGPLYLVGAFVYVKKVPECFYPGQFDLWLHSHQLWHVFVVLAAAAHFAGVYNMFHFRKEHACVHEEAMWQHWELANATT